MHIFDKCISSFGTAFWKVFKPYITVDLKQAAIIKISALDRSLWPLLSLLINTDSGAIWDSPFRDAGLWNPEQSADWLDAMTRCLEVHSRK